VAYFNVQSKRFHGVSEEHRPGQVNSFRADT